MAVYIIQTALSQIVTLDEAEAFSEAFKSATGIVMRYKRRGLWLSVLVDGYIKNNFATLPERAKLREREKGIVESLCFQPRAGDDALTFPVVDYLDCAYVHLLETFSHLRRSGLGVSGLASKQRVDFQGCKHLPCKGDQLLRLAMAGV